MIIALALSLALNALFLGGVVAFVIYIWPGMQIVRRARILLS